MKRFAVPIVGCVSPPIRSRLATLLPAATFCDNWRDVEMAIQRMDSAILFVDPMAVDDCVDDVVRLRDRYPSLTVVVYTVLNPAPIPHVVRMAHAGITDVVLFGFDDKPDRMERLVEDAADARTMCLEPIQPLLDRLPAALRRAVEEMFRQPRRFRSTLDLAAAAGISVRAVFRHLKAAGFVSSRRLVASARVLRACHLLADRGRSGTEVAARLGYRNVDQLSQHLSELVGCTATDVKRGLAPQDLVEVVFRALTPPVEASVRAERQAEYARAD